MLEVKIPEVRNAPEETGQSFLSSANVKTFMYNLEEVQNISCCDNIHLETIGDEKTALFIIVPATDKTFNFMVSMLYTQMFDVLSNRANFKYVDKGRKLPFHVRCIMDEFCNISQIPDFEGKIAFVRSTNISVNIALYEAKDAKAIEIARSEFVRKVKEVDKNLEFSKDKDGFYIIRDKATGKDYPFDNTPDRKFVSLALQKHFGYDENKANIAAQKFGNEMLTGDVKQQYFSDNPLNDFSYVSQVTWDKEDVLVKAYECYYITPKADGISRVVYQKDDGSIAVLNPPRQTKAKMRSILEKELGVTDTKEQDALIAKAEHVSIVNAKYRNVYGNTEDIHIHNATFTKDAFHIEINYVATNSNEK